MPFFINALLWLVILLTVAPTGYFLLKATAMVLPLKKKWYAVPAAFLLLGSTCRLPSWIGDENSAFLLLFFIAAFFLLYEGSTPARLVVCTTFYLLIEPANMILDTVIRISQNWLMEEVVGCLIKTAVAFLIYLLVRSLTKHSGRPRLPLRLWTLCGLLAVGPLCTALSFPIWNGLAHKTIDDSQLRIAYTVLPFVIASACALMITIAELSRQTELEREHRLSGMRELYYENLRSQQNQVRTLRHDLRNHLAALQGLMAEGNYKRAEEYLAELNTSPALHGARQICENEMANVVLSGKLEEMERRGLEADMLVNLPPKLPVADADMCALLGNAMDNAIEAAEKAGDKKIAVRLRADHGMLMLRIENALLEPVKLENGRPATTKTDAAAHGFGLACMEEIASRYKGSLETRAEDGRFELVACLPLSDTPTEIE